jgi:hypothetical protein
MHVLECLPGIRDKLINSPCVIRTLSMTDLRNAPGFAPGSNRQCMKPIRNPTTFRIRVRLCRLPNLSDILKRNKLDDIPALHLTLGLFLIIYLSCAPNHTAPLCLDRIHSLWILQLLISPTRRPSPPAPRLPTSFTCRACPQRPRARPRGTCR